MWHGTSDRFLPAIKKHGLDPRPGHTSFGSGQKGMETYGGVYITNDPAVAEQAAEAAVEKHGGRPILVKVQYALGAGTIDEDKITDLLYAAYRSNHSDGMIDVKGAVDYWREWAEGQDLGATQKTEQLAQRVFALFARWVKRRRLYGRPVSHAHYQEDFLSLASTRSAVEALISSIRVHRGMGGEEDSVRVTRTIGYKGKTRILGFRDLEGRPRRGMKARQGDDQDHHIDFPVKQRRRQSQVGKRFQPDDVWGGW